MSVWTHINGNIRVEHNFVASQLGHKMDDMDSFFQVERAVKEIMGEQSLDAKNILASFGDFERYTSQLNRIGKSDILQGSEGTVWYQCVPEILPEIHYEGGRYTGTGGRRIRFFNILITGDLRDYEDPELAEKWFKNLCEELTNEGLNLRQAVMEIECENEDKPRTVTLGMEDCLGLSGARDND